MNETGGKTGRSTRREGRQAGRVHMPSGKRGRRCNRSCRLATVFSVSVCLFRVRCQYLYYYCSSESYPGIALRLSIIALHVVNTLSKKTSRRQLRFMVYTQSCRTCLSRFSWIRNSFTAVLSFTGFDEGRGARRVESGASTPKAARRWHPSIPTPRQRQRFWGG